jgi:hypothetical protein
VRCWPRSSTTTSAASDPTLLFFVACDVPEGNGARENAKCFRVATFPKGTEHEHRQVRVATFRQEPSLSTIRCDWRGSVGTELEKSKHYRQPSILRVNSARILLKNCFTQEQTGSQKSGEPERIRFAASMPGMPVRAPGIPQRGANNEFSMLPPGSISGDPRLPGTDAANRAPATGLFTFTLGSHSRGEYL